jgi:hypothetical protein
METPSVPKRDLELKPRLTGPKLELTLASAVVILLLVLSTTRALAALPPTISVTPNTFGNGTTIMVSGSGFTSGASVKIWFDTNGNGKLDSGEPETSATVAKDGTFSDVPLLVTGVADGNYFVDSGPSTGALAQTQVTVDDPTILATLSGDLTALETSIEGSITTFQTDVDGQLAGIEASLSSIQTTLNGLPSTDQVQQSYSVHGTCQLNPDNTEYGGYAVACGTFHIAGATWPEAVFTVTLSIESTGLEAGGSVWVGTDAAKIDAASCTAGTCGLDGFTTTVASAGVSIWASCGGLTDSCDTAIVIDYSIVAVASAGGQSLACTTHASNVFC